jgi:uncharacterized membrane-anchored protein
MLKYFIFAITLCCVFSTQAQKLPDTEAESAPAAASKEQSSEQFLAALNFQKGKINLPNGIATINLSEKFTYLSPEDTEKLLVEAWGNPPGNTTLGMIIPAHTSPLGDDGWGVVISYTEDGYVKDSDADEINYDELLEDMQKATAAENEERVKQGYGSMTLVGWAEPPRYDKQTKKMYWAKEYKTGQGSSSLNYNIRVLGRKGVLVLNAIASMAQIQQIKSEMPSILAVTEFTTGNQYADFDSKTDHVAEYGLAALVAGGAAAKMGLFAKLFGLLLVLKKFLVVGVIAAFAILKKIFSKKS